MVTARDIQLMELNRARSLMLRALMKVSHRDYAPGVAELQIALDADPDLISRYCVHAATGGSGIRDQIDIAIITLLQSSSPEFKEAGRVLLLGEKFYQIAPPYQNLSGLPPFRIFRIMRYIDQSDTKIPRLLKSLASNYLHILEQDDNWFDSVALLNRKAIKWAYKRLHLKSSDRAQAILFDNKPPADSKFAAIKLIAAESDVNEKARLIIKHGIPYRIASTLIGKFTAAAGVALISAMSPTEALNSRKWIEASGLLEMKTVKRVYLAKVKRATKSIASADHRVSAQGADEEVQAAIDSAKQTSIETGQRIESDLLMLVDKSGSMEVAIEVAIEFGARIAPLCDGELMVIAHDTEGRLINVPHEEEDSLAAWEHAFRNIRASGGTAHQRGLQLAIEKDFYPQTIVLITDGGENELNFTQMVENYASAHQIEPHVVMLYTPSTISRNLLGPRLEASSIRYDEYQYDGDYYLFDQISAILGGPPAKSLVQKILDIGLPRRE